MKICPTCQAQLTEDVLVCPRCGTVQPQNAPASPSTGAPAPANPGVSAPQTPPAPNGAPVYYTPGVAPGGVPYAAPYVVDPSDHTAEFDAADIHENKIYAMLVYVLSLLGVLVALLAAKDSPYVKFHIRQALQLLVLEGIVSVISVALFWTVVAPFAGAVCSVILVVLSVMGFFQVCGNKAKELPIVKGMNFLK